MGRGRYPTANVPGDFAADRRTATAATTSASVRARWSCVHEQPTGGVRPNARENGQIRPSTIVRASRGAGNRRHLASVLRQGRKPRILTPVWESSGESRFKLNPPIYAGGPVQLLFPWSGSVPYCVGKTRPALTFEAHGKRTRSAQTVIAPHLPV